MQIKSNKATRLLSLFLSILMIITMLPINVLAGNNKTLPANPSYGKPADGWTMNEDRNGMRDYVGVGKKSNSNYSFFLLF